MVKQKMTTEAQEKKDSIRSIEGYIYLIKDSLPSKSLDELEDLRARIANLL